MFRSICLLIISSCGLHGLYAQKQFEVRYLGNMGIAIVHNDSAVIIDGLHDHYQDDYLQTDTSAIGAMLRRQKPYSKIVVIAVTHRHSDHFDENVMASVANVHPAALLVSGSQTKAMLNTDLQKRFSLVAETATFNVGPHLLINARRVPHTYPQRHSAVENYRVEIAWNGFRLVHLGDADTKNEVIAALAERPDVWVVPSWYFDDEGVVLIERNNPVKVIATHITPGFNGMKKIAKIKAEQIFFKKYGDKINISKQ